MNQNINLTNLDISVRLKEDKYKIFSKSQLIGEIDKNKEGLSLLNSLKKIINIYLKTKSSEISLFEENMFLEKIINEANAIIAVVQEDGTMSMINDYATKFLGYTKEEISSEPYFWTKFLKEELKPEVFKIIEDAKKGYIRKHFTTSWISKSKEERIFDWSNSAIYKEDGSLDYIFIIGINITEKTKLEEEVLYQKEQFETIFKTAKDGIAILDLNSNFIDCNDAYLEMTGYKKEELKGLSCVNLSVKEDIPKAKKAIKEVLRKGSIKNFEKSCIKKDGSIIIINMAISLLPNKKQILINTKDITFMKNHQKELEHTANYDLLTDLPNRLLLSKSLRIEMSLAEKNKKQLTLLYLDLDGFKKINDTLGHEIGDELLINLSHQMKLVLREKDILARLGGDEFIIILTNLQNEKHILNIITRLLHIISTPISIKNNTVSVSASIGVTFFPQKNSNVDEDMLLRQADQAMYEAKLRGKNQYVFYNEMTDETYTPGENAFSIKNGLKNDEFILYYQPKIDIKTGEFIGVESLIRWNDPEVGLVFPDNFLPIIDNRPLMYETDKWVFRESINTLDKWQKEGITCSISINLSAYSFKQKDLILFIEKTLNEFPNVSPTKIEIEILETNSLHEMNEIQKIIENLHNKGFSVALDDFGTGYSTLSYLKQLKVDTLKIDKSFIIDLLNDKNDFSIVQAAISLANSFKAKSIAEGVESIEHLTILRKLGCNFAQGYAISRPLPEDKFKIWLQNWEPSKCI